MNPVAEDIKDLLVMKGMGNFASVEEDQWGVFVEVEPDLPDDCITVNAYSTSQGKSFNTNNAFVRTSVQIRVRCFDYLGGFKKAKEIQAMIDRCGRMILGGIEYLNVVSNEPDPLSLGRDVKKRQIWVQNYTVFRKE